MFGSIFMDNRWPLKYHARILGFCQERLFCVLTRKKIISPKLFFVNFVRAGTRSSLQYFIWLKSKRVQIYSVVKSVKLLLVLSIFTTRVENSVDPDLLTQKPADLDLHFF